MKLPLNSHIDPRKLTEYLLRRRLEDDKSAFLALAGYTADNAGQLLTDIRDQILPLDAEFIEQTEYGPKVSDSKHVDWAQWEGPEDCDDLDDRRHDKPDKVCYVTSR